MINYINKEYALADSPLTSSDWKKKSEKERTNLINKELRSSSLYEGFEVISSSEEGQTILKIEKSIPANERGVLLLDLEDLLKNSIDKGITIWLEPIGDKSKLRNLRGIKFKTVD